MKVLNTNESINLSGLLSASAPNKVFIAIVLACIAGLAYALIIPLILRSLEESPLDHQIMHLFDTEQGGEHFHLFGLFDVSTPGLAFAFLTICLIILVCRAFSQAILTRTVIEVTVDLRKKVYRRISQVPIEDIEKIGASRLITALNRDIPQIIAGAAVFPGLVSSIATLVGLLAFLIYLNIQVFFFIIGAIIFGAITYQIPLMYGRRFMHQARDNYDDIQEGMRGLIYGAKELKLNQKKQQNFLAEDLDNNEAEFLKLEKNGQTLVMFGKVYGDLISFFAIGAVAYVVSNYYELSRENLTGIIMVMLYITGPILALITAASPIMQATVASKKLKRLLSEMPVEDSKVQTNINQYEQVEVDNIKYCYSTNKHESSKFSIGPINMTLRRGEVTFLVGGNGSGKTTLAKLLSLHYIPQEGVLRFDDQVVTNSNRNTFRQTISAIYSNFYLFTKPYGIDREDLDEQVSKYIKKLKLEGKVEFNNGRFSNIDLSDGQKKRLALLVSYLEDRSIYIFDEWAADQDPEFKKIFYNQIIPDLKKKNKLIVVISHDDRYFHLADTIVSMESGQIKDIISNSRNNENPQENRKDLIAAT